jgi:hypothetical protein
VVFIWTLIVVFWVAGERGPDLTDVADRMSADQITGRITNGSANMPANIRVPSPEETRALVAFLATHR